MTDRTYTIHGKVTAPEHAPTLPRLVVEARDKEHVCKDVLGRTETNENGEFTIQLTDGQFSRWWGAERRPDLYFVVSFGPRQVSTESDVLWNVKEPEKRVEIGLPEDFLRLVRGRITTVSRIGVPEVTVHAFSKALSRDPVELGVATTDSEGAYELDYLAGARKLGLLKPVDMFVECYGLRVLLARSELIFRAPMVTVVDLVVADSVRPPPTEFESLATQLGPELRDLDVEQLKWDDEEFLAAKLRLAPAKVRQFMQAARLHLDASRLAQDHPVPPEAWYALVAEDAELGLGAIVEGVRATLDERITRGVRTRLVPARLGDDRGILVDALKEVAVALALAGRGVGLADLGKLVALAPGSSEEARKRFLRLYVLNEKPLEEFWADLSSDSVLANYVPVLRRLFELYAATGDNYSLVEYLHQSRETNTDADLAALDAKGWLTLLQKADAAPLGGEARSPRNLDEYAIALARRFQRRLPATSLVRRLVAMAGESTGRPSEALRKALDTRVAVSIEKQPVSQFLDKVGIREKFERALSDARDETTRQGLKQDQEAVVGELRRLHVAHLLVPGDDKVPGVAALSALEVRAPFPGVSARSTALARTSVTVPGPSVDALGGPTERVTRATSATRIASIGRSAFLSAWQKLAEAQGMAASDARAAGAAIYKKAQYIAFRTAINAWNSSAALDSVVPQVVARSHAATARNLAKVGWDSADYANLTTLFGSANSCECPHCESVFAPAAYMVHLMGMLEPAWETISARRPDIFLLDLDCRNTQTKLPYIDLLNEHLELLVAPQGSGPAYDLQTTLSEPELRLRPEHELPEAYVELASCAFPLSLPWDRWFSEARICLEHVGLPLHRLCELFVGTGFNSAKEWGGLWSCRRKQVTCPGVVRAHLGLTVPLFDLIAKPIPNDDSATYRHSGEVADLVNEHSVDALRPLTALMHKLGLWCDGGASSGATKTQDREDYRLFRRILGTRYVQDSRSSSSLVIDIEFDAAKPCDPGRAVISNLTQDTVVRLVKFEHLRRALNWTPEELNRAILTFAPSAQTAQVPTNAIDERVLADISAVERLRREGSGGSTMELLSWWGPLDTGAGMRPIGSPYESEKSDPTRLFLYDQVFLDRSLFTGQSGEAGDADAVRSYLELNEARTDLAYLGRPSQKVRPVSELGATIAAALKLSSAELTDLVAFVRKTYFAGAPELWLCLPSLSALYRVVSISRYLGLTTDQFVVAHGLVEDDLRPFVAGETASTLLFVEVVRQVGRSSFTVHDLAYLLAHHTRSPRELDNLERRIGTYLLELRAVLAEARTSSSPMAPAAQKDPAQEVEAILDALGPDKAATARLLKFLKQGEQSSMTQGEVKRALPFLRATQLNELDAVARRAPGSPGLYEELLPALLSTLGAKTLVLNRLAEFSGLDARTTQTLVNPATLLAFIVWAGSEPVDDANAKEVRDALVRLEKQAALIHGWKLDADEIGYIDRYPEHFERFSFARLPVSAPTSAAPKAPGIKSWSTVTTYVELRDRLGLAGAELREIFQEALTVDSESDADRAAQLTAALLDHLAQRLRIQAAQLRRLADGLQYLTSAAPARLARAALAGPETFKPLADVVSASRRVGVSCDTLQAWAGIQGSENPQMTLDASFLFPGSGDQAPKKQALLRHKQRTVEAIRAVVRGRSSDADWHRLATAYQNDMRTQQRDRLLDYVLHPPSSFPSGLVDLIRSVEDVHDFLLMDPLVGPSMYTTRLKQALSSVQLYIHRALMGLEVAGFDENGLKDLSETWKWKKTYRVWEAHRKVLLYPENWLEPELRDDKTPFFVEFEGELMQSHLDASAIEKAFIGYLAKVEEVGHLEVAAFLETGLPQSETHIIGRTRDKPRTHYYRQRGSGGRWEPWRRVDLDIDSEVVLLAVYRGALYVLWPSVKERTQKLGQDNPDDPKNQFNNYRPVLDIALNWSKYADGRWSTRKRTTATITLMCDWRHKELYGDLEALAAYKVQVGSTLQVSVGLIAETYRERCCCEWDDGNLKKKLDEVQALLDRTYAKCSYAAIYTSISGSLCPVMVALPMVSVQARACLRQGYWLSAKAALDYLSAASNQLRNALASTQAFADSGTDFKPIEPADINLVESRYRHATITSRGSYDNRMFTVGKFELSGHKLQETAVSSTGLVAQTTHYRDSLGAAQAEEASAGIARGPAPSPAATQYRLVENEAQASLEAVPDHNAYTILFGPGGSAGSPGGSPASTAGGGTLVFRYVVSGVVRDLALLGVSTAVRVVPAQGYWSQLSRFFCSDHERCYEFAHRLAAEPAKYEARPFFHPFIGEFNEMVSHKERPLSERLATLLSLDTQCKRRGLPYSRGPNLTPTAVDIERVDFKLSTPFGVYNWEIFLHLPLTIAVRLSENKRFQEAQEWFHYIFNPLQSRTIPGADYTDDAERRAASYWNVLPLHALGMPPEVTLDAIEDAAVELAKDPFQPHRVARMRLGAYQKSVVMKYLDNLIAWGDQLFEMDTIESINEATHLYLLARRILGPRPKVLPKPALHAEAANGSSAALSAPRKLTELSGVSVRLETAELTADALTSAANAADAHLDAMTTAMGEVAQSQWFVGEPPDATAGAGESSTVLADRPAFCIPPNDKLVTYWDVVADRLFKVRTCRSIAGQVRELPIFEPPIDPALLVRAWEQGVDVEEVLSDLRATLPPFRFVHMLQKAYEFCGDVRSLGGALLSAIEKRDAEAISLLRSQHERSVLELTESTRKRQIEEQQAALKATRESLEIACARQEYYGSRPFMNADEQQNVSKLSTANDFNIASQVVNLAAAGCFVLPNIHLTAGLAPSISIETGGRALGDALRAVGSFLAMIANVYSHEATMHSIQGGHQRRMDDWVFQADQAKREMAQIGKQILGAEIRLDIAEKELEAHRQRQEQAEEIEAFLASKFTNQELYHWSAARASDIYFQSYRMALELARAAQQCYRIEQRDDEASFVKGGHWDNLKKGLFAGEKLQFDLRRMESAYLEGNARQLEVEKRISLRALAPLQLDALRYHGTCTFVLPELLFDLDYPGHYYRRIKSVRVSIPSIVGPCADVSCRLRLESSHTRTKPEVGDGSDILKLDQELSPRTVALSSASNDAGLFQLSPDDQRYLPFELYGVVKSTWTLEFPSAYASFDRTTISDVVLTVQYTALEDGVFRDRVKEGISAAYKAATGVAPDRLAQRLDIRREYPEKWHEVVGTGALVLPIDQELFPYLVRPVVQRVIGFAVLCATPASHEFVRMGGYTLGPQGPVQGAPEPLNVYGLGPTEVELNFGGSVDLSVDPTTLDPKELRELIVVLFYAV